MRDLTFNVEMFCMTCGCTQLAYEIPKAGQDFADDCKFICGHCGREMTRAELLEANSASINAVIEDSGEVIAKAAAKEIQEQLRKVGW